jgi:hypothetical protein
MQAVDTTNTSYEVKNLLLTQPSDWFIEDKTFQAVKESQLDIVRFLKSKGQENLDNLPLHSVINEPIKDVYTAPIFSETFCDIFKDELDNIKKHFNFEPNTDEDKLRQIPEIVLQDHIPELVPVFDECGQHHTQSNIYGSLGQSRNRWRHTNSQLQYKRQTTRRLASRCKCRHQRS